MTLDALLTLLFAAAAFGYAMLGAWILRAGQGAQGGVGLTFFLVGAWVAGGALQLQGNVAELVAVGRVVHFLGASLLPMAVLLCFRGYTGAPLSRAWIVTLGFIPAVSIILAGTNSLHQWMWLESGPRGVLEPLASPTAWGPWFRFVHIPYGYFLLMTGIVTLLLHSTAVAPANRRVVLMLAATAIIPAAALAVHDLGIGPATVSVVPVVFAVLLPVYAWLVLRERVIEFAPLAYETVFQTMQDPVVVVDGQQRVIGLNRGAERLLKVSEADALRSPLSLLFDDDVPAVHAALDNEEPQRMLTRSGRFLHLQASPIDVEHRQANGGRVLIFRDVSDVEKAQHDVRSSEKLLRTLIEHSVNGIVRLRWVVSEDSRELRCVFANRAAGRFLHADAGRLIDRSARNILLLACSGMSEAESRAVVADFISRTGQGEVADIETRVERGSESKWLRVIGEPVGDNVAVTFVDVTDRKAKELHMETMAWSDPLTGVLNRRGFERDAARRLSESDDLASGALFFIDLNQFKQINDRCGHEVGDRVLTIVADRLRKTLRSCDIIGRPGGDEFVALVPDVDAELADNIAERVTRRLEQPYRVGADKLACPASIGMALYPLHASTLTGLMRAADQAMYRAKARSRGISDVGRDELFEKAG